MDGTRSALIVASHEYEDLGLRQLRAPGRDAEALARVLRDPEIGGFDVRTMLNQPEHVVREAVEEFFADRAPEDLLLLHFSCHGIKDEDGELYFATSNTKLRRLGATAVPAEFVNRRMNRTRSKRVVLFLDCCYAGAFERGMVARAGTGMGIESQFGGRGRAVITASSAMEYAFEGDQLADTLEVKPSVFTSALVHGLETGDADRDQDGMVGLDELYDHVYDRVREMTPNQTPGKWTFGVQGELVIARRSRPVSKPTPLAPELQQAVEHPLASVRAAAIPDLGRMLAGTHAGIALAAKLALERLTGDDSRIVSASATATLAAHVVIALPAPPPVEAPSDIEAPLEAPGVPPVIESVAPTVETPPHVEAPVSAAAAPPAVQPMAQAAQVAPGSELAAPAANASPGAEPTQPATVDPLIAEPASPIPEAESGSGSGSGSDQDRTEPVPGRPDAMGDQPAQFPELVASWAIAGAVLLLVVLVVILPSSRRTDFFIFFFFYNPAGVAGLVILIALAAAGGLCMLISRTCRLIGPGLLLGALTAAGWGVLNFGAATFLFGELVDESRAGVLIVAVLALIGNASVVMAAGLGALALRRGGEVRVVLGAPKGALAWAIVILGLAGGIAFLSAHMPPTTNPAITWRMASLWPAAVALVLPAFAVLAEPRRFGVAVLGGWAASGTALFFMENRLLNRGDTGPQLAAFGLTLIALLFMTILFARGGRRADGRPSPSSP
jgi:Caspase domain